MLHGSNHLRNRLIKKVFVILTGHLKCYNFVRGKGEGGRRGGEDCGVVEFVDFFECVDILDCRLFRFCRILSSFVDATY